MCVCVGKRFELKQNEEGPVKTLVPSARSRCSVFQSSHLSRRNGNDVLFLLQIELWSQISIRKLGVLGYRTFSSFLLFFFRVCGCKFVRDSWVFNAIWIKYKPWWNSRTSQMIFATVCDDWLKSNLTYGCCLLCETSLAHREGKFIWIICFSITNPSSPLRWLILFFLSSVNLW